MTYYLRQRPDFKIPSLTSIKITPEKTVHKAIAVTSYLILFLFSTASLADILKTETNNGNLKMEDIPDIPQSIVADLSRYQNVRSAGFRAWTQDGNAIFVSTRFGDVSQIHRVGHPGGARQQVTFFDEPVGGLQRQPNG